MDITEATMGRIEELLELLGVQCEKDNRKYYGACPVHEGDNEGAFNLFHADRDGEGCGGNWVCWTHHCEQQYGKSLVGLVRGILSKDGSTSTYEALNYIERFLGDVKLSKRVKDHHKVFSPIETEPLDISREQIRSSLGPPKYFIKRGYDPAILDKYDVGFCSIRGKQMYMREVVPIYDRDFNYVGCQGRSIYEKCLYCKGYHILGFCPPKKYHKWRHSRYFKSAHYLYNHWYAKDHFNGTAILVEGASDVWTLESNGIHCSLAVFGDDLSDMQKRLLDQSGVMNLILLMDNDKAGKAANIRIKKKCKKDYNIIIPEIESADIGCANNRDINMIKRILENL